jgi:RimJ/RimL family protein N-acetyltransferase
VIPSPWPLRSGAVLLRDAAADDVEQLLSFRNDPDVNRFMIRTSVEPDTFRDDWLAVATSDRDFSCVAELDGDVAAMGFLEVVDGMGQPGMPTGTEDHLGLRRVTAGCNADNAASVRVLEKAGMRREQHGVQDSWHAELGWVDGYQYALLADEWRAAHDREGVRP